MTTALAHEAPPLAADAAGILRVGGTRVSLDQVVAAFREGASPEEIALRYPVLALGDVYGALAYYLHHREQVELYLSEQSQRAAEMRQVTERRFPTAELRERLLARSAART